MNTLDLNTIGIMIGAAIALVVVLYLLLRARPRRIEDGEGHGVTDGAAAAIEDAIGEILGVDAHHQPPTIPEAVGDPDPLTTLKGLGPKAAAQLNALGIVRFDQLGALDAAQIAAVDAEMGTFKGRIFKDRWVEQARYLAAGDKAGFEAQFGKLG
jgi:predicted flap endonuclease-1-like 5' DNA nuclease